MATFEDNYNIGKKYVQCPYNANHKIPSNRLPFHLIKCEKTSNVVLMVCPFNATHRYHKDKRDEHLNQCKDRINVLDLSKNQMNITDLSPKLDKSSQRLIPFETQEMKKEVKPKLTSDEYWD